MDRLEAEHAARPLDLILITGDMTDAGLSTEWAEFVDVLARHPDLTERMFILPGNHDVNIVDRANPARLNLPFSPTSACARCARLSAIAACRAIASRYERWRPGASALTLRPLAPDARIEAFADTGRAPSVVAVARLWDELFPMILPPDETTGSASSILNSNAETHFSFTNALGLIPWTRLAACAAIRPLSDALVDRRAAPSSDRISDAGEGILGADRHGARQWQLVRAQAQAIAERPSSCTAIAISTGSAPAAG